MTDVKLLVRNLRIVVELYKKYKLKIANEDIAKITNKNL